MLFNLFSLLFLGAAVLGITVTSLLVTCKASLNQNWHLMVCLCSLSVCTAYIFSFTTGLLVHVPWFFSIARVSSFLIAPSAFLYIRNVLAPKRKFNLLDTLHYLPCLICLTLVCLSYKNGITFNEMILKHSDVWKSTTQIPEIDANYLRIGKTFLWFGYVIAQSIMIMRFEQIRTVLNLDYDAKLLSWLKTFNLMIVLLFTSILIGGFVKNRFHSLEFLNNTLCSFILISTAGWMLFKPEILYGTAKPVIKQLYLYSGSLSVEDLNDHIKDINPFLTDLKREEYIKVLDEYLEVEKPFLKKGIVIRDFSDDTEIPVHHLSYLINSEYNLHFQDFVNLQRINYIKSRVNDPIWKRLSLEGIAWDAGFSSRTTFYRAFIKLTGESPSEYFNYSKAQA